MGLRESFLELYLVVILGRVCAKRKHDEVGKRLRVAVAALMNIYIYI